MLDEEDVKTECDVLVEGIGAWRLTGGRIEKAAAMTNWDYAEAQDRFQRIMGALGASEQLKKAGAKNGDLIMVGNVDFTYFEESPMAARARLAGYGDDAGDDADGFDFDAEAKRLAKELDSELADLLDGHGDVVEF